MFEWYIRNTWPESNLVVDNSQIIGSWTAYELVGRTRFVSMQGETPMITIETTYDG